MHFASDNTAPVSPEILAAIGAANSAQVSSYGADALTVRLTERARDVFETDLALYPVGTGTAANALALATLVNPYGAVLCADEAHIATDECGAPEFYTGGAQIAHFDLGPTAASHRCRLKRRWRARWTAAFIMCCRRL